MTITHVGCLWLKNFGKHPFQKFRLKFYETTSRIQNEIGQEIRLNDSRLQVNPDFIYQSYQ